MFYVFTDVHYVVHNIFKITQKADCAVKELAIFPTIEDLAEAWELKINYA